MPATSLNSVFSLKSGLAKNYITLGDFENGDFSTWSLVNTSLNANDIPNSSPSAGTPFSSTNGGSNASANLSLSLVSSGQLAGNYSLAMTSSAASVAGDMLISQPYAIDKEDQAKTLTIRFAYSVISGLTNLSLTGTSAGSFSVYVYDVANGQFIQPAGVYNIIQGTGAGYCSATFQSASNATTYQLCFINQNASTGAFQMYFDDFFIGPQSTLIGPSLGDFVNYGANTIGITSGTAPTKGTVVTDKILGKRVGDIGTVNVVYEQNTAGTAGTASQDYLYTLPSGWQFNLNVYPAFQGNVASNALSENSAATKSMIPCSGFMSFNATDYAFMQGAIPWDATRFRIFINYQVGADQFCQGSGLMPLSAAGLGVSVTFSAPMQGWSSNSVMSQDTDTRVVSMVATTSTTASSGTTVPFVYTSIVQDTHGAYSTTTGKFTAPVAGTYQITAGINSSGVGTAVIEVRKNNTVIFIGEEGTSTQAWTVSGIWPLAAGDTIDIVPNTALTGAGSATQDYFMVNRLSGPAVVTAADAVNARYFASATAITSSLATISWTTKDYDSHNQMSAGTYTIATPGKYQIDSLVTLTAASAAAGNAVNIQIQKNGTVVSEFAPVYQSTQVTLPIKIDDQINCLAGDTIRIQVSSAATTPSIVSSNSKNYFSISRLGN